MDPINIVGLTGSIVNIVDVIAKSIKTLRDLEQRWKAADWTVNSLISQLNTLRTALGLIQEWMSSSLAGKPNGQLMIDLSESLKCCKSLVTFMHEHLSQLNWTEGNTLTFLGKVRAVFHDEEVRECARHLNHQSIALNLLLTALNCKSLSQQTYMVQCQENRAILKQVKDDSSSLLGLRAGSSFRSSRTASVHTRTPALLSVVFDVDEEILGSSTYQRQMRSLLREKSGTRMLLNGSNTRRLANAPHKQADPVGSTLLPTRWRELEFREYRHSELEEHFRRKNHFPSKIYTTVVYLKDGDTQPPVFVPIFGGPKSQRFAVMELLKSIPASGRAIKQRVEARDVIHLNLISAMQFFLKAIIFLGVDNPSVKLTNCAGTLLSLPVINTFEEMVNKPQWTAEIARAARILSKLYDQMELHKCYNAVTTKGVPQWVSYLICSAPRIAQSDYVPTDHDINKIALHPTRVCEARTTRADWSIHFVLGEHYLHDFDLDYPPAPPASIVVFVVDMSCKGEDHKVPSADLERHFSEDSIAPTFASSRGHEDFSECINTYIDYVDKYNPKHVVMLIDMSRVNTQKWQETSRCIENKISRLQLIGQGRKVYMHYVQYIDLACVEFVLGSIEEALHHAKTQPSKHKTPSMPKS